MERSGGRKEEREGWHSDRTSGPAAFCDPAPSSLHWNNKFFTLQVLIVLGTFGVCPLLSPWPPPWVFIFFAEFYKKHESVQ